MQHDDLASSNIPNRAHESVRPGDVVRLIRVVVRWSGLPSNTHARSHRHDSVELLLVGRDTP